MAALPASPVPTISPAEMQILISRSGLVLNPGQMADLVLAWRQVAGLIAALPQGRSLVDDLAYSFRLPPPAGTAAAAKPAARAAAEPSAKPSGKTAKPRSLAKPKPRVTSKAKPQASRRHASGGR
jgi:hypothetical protein